MLERILAQKADWRFFKRNMLISYTIGYFYVFSVVLVLALLEMCSIGFQRHVVF